VWLRVWRPRGPPGTPVFENVVVGATDSDGATRAVRRAIEVARASGGTLHIVAALGSPRADKPDAPREARSRRRSGFRTRAAHPVDALLGQLRAMATDAHVRVATHPVSADPADAIARVALQEDADLIVVGTRSEGGTRRLSAVPKAVMDKANCAVLVV
jgi:nucleotide-binding universal stress UspA family protein